MVSEMFGLFGSRRGLQRLSGFGTKKGSVETLSSLGLTRKGECSPPSTFVLPRVQPPRLPKFLKRISLDPKGRLCATFGTFGSPTNIFCPSGHWSGLVTMKTVNSHSIIAAVQSGGADTSLHILQALGPGSATLKVEHVHIG